MVVSMQTQTKETRLYNSMERTLGHIFALTLGIGPNNQIHSLWLRVLCWVVLHGAFRKIEDEEHRIAYRNSATNLDMDPIHRPEGEFCERKL